MRAIADRAGRRGRRTGRCATRSAEPDRPRLTRRGRPAVRRDERLRLPGLGAALLPGRAAGRRASSSTTRRACGAVELNNTYYQSPQPDKVAAWLAATPDDVPVLGQGPARRLVPRRSADPATSVAVADRAVPGVRGAARDASCFRVPDVVKRDDDAARRPPGRLAARPAADHGVPGSVAGTSTRPSRRSPRPGPPCAPPNCPTTRSRRPSGGPGRSSTCACAGTTTTPTSSRRGRRGWSRSSPPATTRTCSSATTRSAVARSWRSSSARPSRRRGAPGG